MFHKKIALFISHIYGDYQRELSQGVADKALEYGYQTEVYTTNDGETLGGLTETEKCVLRLPVYENLSGIVFASGTYSSREFRNSICSALQGSGLPVIEVNDTDPVFPAVSMDNNTMFRDLVLHFITEHGAKRLCYLGCKNETVISEIRFQVIRDTLKEKKLPFGEGDYYQCDETPEDYVSALQHLTDNGKNFPDAILCYNDRLAYALSVAAEDLGYRIPEDFGISGCDNSDAGQNMIPTLTTISYPVYELGQLAVDDLLSLIKGREPAETQVCAKALYGGSCGCSCGADRKNHLYAHTLVSRIADLERSIILTAQMASDFDTIDDIDDSLDIIAESAEKIRDCTGFYMAVSSRWNNLSGRILTLTAAADSAEETGEDDDTMTMYLAIQNGMRLPGCTFKKGELLPDFLMSDKENVRVVSPIYHHGSSYGYVVMTFENDRIRYPFQLIQYLVNLSQLLNNLRNKKRSEAMATHLEEIYMRDSLTGLYNKAGFEYYRDKLVESLAYGTELAVLFVDMNGLKQINDSFGHDAGDFSIQVLGQAISRALTEGEMAGRVGGDEFLIITPGGADRAGEIEKKIQSYLENYRKLNPGEYTISASIGSACATASPTFVFADLVKEADAQMYDQKKKNRGSR